MLLLGILPFLSPKLTLYFFATNFSYTPSYFVELIQLLPVLLEFGEYKLYDIDQFVGYYPELEDEYYHKREHWNDTYYYAIVNLQPDPENWMYFRYLDEDIVSMLDAELMKRYLRI